MHIRSTILLLAVFLAVPAATAQAGPNIASQAEGGIGAMGSDLHEIDRAAAEAVRAKLGEIPSGLTPAFVRVAQAKASGNTEWRTMAERVDIRVRDDGRVAVYVDINAQYLTWNDGVMVNPPESFDPADKVLLASLFDLHIRPTDSTSRFLAWIEPEQVVAFFLTLQEAYPNATAGREPGMESHSYGFYVSEGRQQIYADQYHSRGVTGRDVPMAVIDLDFGGINSTAASEVGQYYYHTSQYDLDYDNGTHGTACLEIIRDVAPDAGPIYVIRDGYSGTSIDIESCVNWLQAQSPAPEIISYSVGYVGYPENGAVCDAARDALSSGMRWVNSAGNYASGEYWEMGNPSIGSNGYVYIGVGTAQINDIDYYGGGNYIDIWLSYEAPNSSYARYEIELYEFDGYSWYLVDWGNGNPQTQRISYTKSYGYDYGFAIYQSQPGIAGRMRVQAFDNEFYGSNVEGSVINPASIDDINNQLLTIGAVSTSVYPYSNAYPTNYSSAGGGAWNLPLDWCAPTDVSTRSYTYPFNGTSAAAPHMAGLLGLHYSNFALRASPLGTMRVRDIDLPGPDVYTGLGVILGDPNNIVTVSPDAYEPDNTPGSARPIDGSQPATGHTIAPRGDVDYFTFTLIANSNVTVSTSGTHPDGDTEIELLAANGTTSLGYNDDSGADRYSSLTVNGLSAGTYYVRVTGWGDYQVPDYQVNLDVFMLPDGFESDDTPLDATPAATGLTGYRNLNTVDDEDLVSLPISVLSDVRISTNGVPGYQVVVDLLDGAGLTVASTATSGGTLPSAYPTLETQAQPGTYYVRVRTAGSVVPSYSLAIEVTAVPISGGGTGPCAFGSDAGLTTLAWLVGLLGLLALGRTRMHRAAA